MNRSQSPDPSEPAPSAETTPTEREAPFRRFSAMVRAVVPVVANEPSEAERQCFLAERRARFAAGAEDAFRKSIPEKYAAASVRDLDDARNVPWGRIDGVLLAGNVGIGKTHAAFALAVEHATGEMLRAFDRRQGEYNPDGDAVRRAFGWTHAPAVLRRIRATFRNGSRESEDEILDDLIRFDVLVLDDMGSEKITDFSSSTMYQVLYEREMRGRKTIVTTNQSLAEIDQWEPRIASRLNAYFRVKLPDIDRRARIGADINRRSAP